MAQVLIIGGGIVGLATALRFLETRPRHTITVLEKEPGPGRHQSTHNSGVLHAGLYYKPGSLKARLSVAGIRQMVAFCQEHRVAHEICGKLVVATNPQEEARLNDLLGRSQANGLTGVRLLSFDQMRKIEPHVGGLAALHVPEEGIVDYAQVCARIVEQIQLKGGALHFSSQVTRVKPHQNGWSVLSTKGDFQADYLINCAGLHSDRVATLAGEKPPSQIVPFRGEYYKLRPERQSLVRHLIYPVPDPQFPFLGVHFTRLIHGGVEAGPNAVLAFAREGYRKTQVIPADLFESLTFPGLWRFMAKNRSMCWSEVRRSWSRGLFCKSLQQLVPDLKAADLAPGGAGVRAQAMLPTGELVQDFSLVQARSALHVICAPSPAATASLAIGDEIIRLAGL